jgi:hypothetical protein
MYSTGDLPSTRAKQAGQDRAARMMRTALRA